MRKPTIADVIQSVLVLVFAFTAGAFLLGVLVNAGWSLFKLGFNLW